jgi:hypothetical protein
LAEKNPVAKHTDFHGSHEILPRDEHIEGSSDKGFGQVFAVVFALIATFSWWFNGKLWPYWLAGSAVFLILAYTYPKILGPINRGWMKFGYLLFIVLNPIMMGIIYYLVVTPIGLLLRLLGKDLLSLKWDKSAKSYWINRDPPGPEPESLKNQF